MSDSVEAGDWLGLRWSHWGPLDKERGYLKRASTDEGLYRIRHPEHEGLVYIGETGRSTSGRIHALARGAFAEQMPYRDPHTAAPCLWAIVDRDGAELEVSWTTPRVAADKQDRKGLEAALIAAHRRDVGTSPTANFGRIIHGYRQSSYSRDGNVGGRLREDESEPNTKPGVGPLNWSNHESLFADDWMGLNWSAPKRLQNVSARTPESDGLYRLWNEELADCLHYIGESSNLRSRLRTHRRERDDRLYYSYARLDNHDALHKRQEVETELIGAHWLECERAPASQWQSEQF